MDADIVPSNGKDQCGRIVPGLNGGTLHPWAKGQSGNPRGNPGVRPQDVIKAALESVPAGDANPDGKTFFEILIESMRNRAIKGDARFAQMILDRYMGKQPELVSVLDTTDLVRTIAVDEARMR